MTSQSALLRQEAPCATSRSTASKWPLAAADCTALQDLELRMLGSAAATSKASTASVCPAQVHETNLHHHIDGHLFNCVKDGIYSLCMLCKIA